MDLEKGLCLHLWYSIVYQNILVKIYDVLNIMYDAFSSISYNFDF